MLSFKLYRLEVTFPVGPAVLGKVAGTEVEPDVLQLGQAERILEQEDGGFRIGNVGVTVRGLDSDYFLGADDPNSPFVFEITDGSDVIFHGPVEHESIAHDEGKGHTTFSVLAWEGILAAVNSVPARSVYEADIRSSRVLGDGIRLYFPANTPITVGDTIVSDGEAGEFREVVNLEGSDDYGRYAITTASRDYNLIEDAPEATGEISAAAATFPFVITHDPDATHIQKALPSNSTTGGGEPTWRPMGDQRAVFSFYDASGNLMEQARIVRIIYRTTEQGGVNVLKSYVELDPNEFTRALVASGPGQGAGSFTTWGITALSLPRPGNRAKILGRDFYGYTPPNNQPDADVESIIEAMLFLGENNEPDESFGRPLGILPNIVRNVSNPTPSPLVRTVIDRTVELPDRPIEALRLLQRTSEFFLRVTPLVIGGLPQVDIDLIPREEVAGTAVQGLAGIRQWITRPVPARYKAVVVKPNNDYRKPDSEHEYVGVWWVDENGDTPDTVTAAQLQYLAVPTGNDVLEIEVAVHPAYDADVFFAGGGRAIGNDFVLKEIAKSAYEYFAVDGRRFSAHMAVNYATDVLGKRISVNEGGFARTVFITKQSSTLVQGALDTHIEGIMESTYTPPEGTPPIAVASGLLTYVDEDGDGELIQLSAAHSSSPSGHVLSYEWRRRDFGTIPWSGVLSNDPEFSEVRPLGKYDYQLRVYFVDGVTFDDFDEVTVSVSLPGQEGPSGGTEPFIIFAPIERQAAPDTAGYLMFDPDSGDGSGNVKGLQINYDSTEAGWATVFDTLNMGELDAIHQTLSLGTVTPSTPAYRFEIKNGNAIHWRDDEQNVTNYMFTDGAYAILNMAAVGGATAGFVSVQSSGMQIGTSTNQHLVFTTNNTPRVDIQANGNVHIGGIGAAVPEKLRVTGSIMATADVRAKSPSSSAYAALDSEGLIFPDSATVRSNGEDLTVEVTASEFGVARMHLAHKTNHNGLMLETTGSGLSLVDMIFNTETVPNAYVRYEGRSANAKIGNRSLHFTVSATPDDPDFAVGQGGIAGAKVALMAGTAWGHDGVTRLQVAGGNIADASTASQIAFEYISGGMRHEVLSRHSASTASKNEIAFRLWRDTDMGGGGGAEGDRALYEVLTLGGTRSLLKGHWWYETSGAIGTESFASGFGGYGWRVENTLIPVGGSGEPEGHRATYDHLTVRGTFAVYELLVRQIRATNGSLFVSNGFKVDTVTELSGNYILTADAENYVPVLVGDFLIAQRLAPDGTEMYQSRVQVVAVAGDASTATVSVLAGDIPEVGFEYVRYDSTNANRRGYLYLTADDDESPFMAVRQGTGTGTWPAPDSEYVRMGRLDGRTPFVSGANKWGFAAGSTSAGASQIVVTPDVGLAGGVEFYRGSTLMSYYRNSGFYVGGDPSDNTRAYIQYIDATDALTLVSQTSPTAQNKIDITASAVSFSRNSVEWARIDGTGYRMGPITGPRTLVAPTFTTIYGGGDSRATFTSDGMRVYNQAGDPRLTVIPAYISIGTPDAARVMILPEEIEFYSPSNVRKLHMTADGEITLGDTDTNHLFIDPFSVNVFDEFGTSRAYFGNTVRVGTPTGPRVEITAAPALLLKNNTSTFVSITTTGASFTGTVTAGQAQFGYLPISDYFGLAVVQGGDELVRVSDLPISAGSPYTPTTLTPLTSQNCDSTTGWTSNGAALSTSAVIRQGGSGSSLVMPPNATPTLGAHQTVTTVANSTYRGKTLYVSFWLARGASGTMPNVSGSQATVTVKATGFSSQGGAEWNLNGSTFVANAFVFFEDSFTVPENAANLQFAVFIRDNQTWYLDNITIRVYEKTFTWIGPNGLQIWNSPTNYFRVGATGIEAKFREVTVSHLMIRALGEMVPALQPYTGMLFASGQDLYYRTPSGTTKKVTLV